ncbi:MAG TPA: DegT/DnrJ/EryC1/StrS aminotransferase family protein [Acidimicrobiales bacterium]|nr:DegT/DnrJ/EryC1/StrS aminotransferase family protein [Acidimicrobiales bacterium]
MSDVLPDQTIQFAAPDIDPADIAAVVAVLERGWITTGDECSSFESELAEHLGAPHVIAMASCTAALETAAAWLRLPRGTRVGVPTWTFASSALVLAHQGYVPVLLDVDPATLNVSAEAIDAAAANDDIKALLLVHYAGVPVGADARAAAETHGLSVIEDAAHALGATDDRGAVWGQGSVAGCFSFYATKNLTSAEGGALATADDDVAAFARSFRQHGMSADAWSRYRPGAKPRYDIHVDGIKANFPDILAALARSQLRRFDALQQKRRELHLRYHANLAPVAAVRMVPSEPVPGSADHLAVVRLEPSLDRDRIVEALAAAGIGSSVHFVPLHQMSWFKKNARICAKGVDNAELAAPSILSLPLHTKLAPVDVDRVCSVLADAVEV